MPTPWGGWSSALRETPPVSVREHIVSIWAPASSGRGHVVPTCRVHFRSSNRICGGGRESNPPTDSRRRTGFEGHRRASALVGGSDSKGPVTSGFRPGEGGCE